jgi:hypothetical protein
MNPVVRLAFENAKSGQSTVTQRFWTGEREEISRRECIQQGLQGNGFCRFFVESRVSFCQATGMGQVEKELAPWVIDNVEPEVFGRTDSARE